MEFRNVGRSGLITSVVGLGCNNFGMKLDKDASVEIVQAAIDAGYTMFDTSDSYGKGASEEFLGSALGDRRDEVLVATKFVSPMGDGPYRKGASRRYVVDACEASLRRLGTDWIDLYYQHRPDPATPVEETLDALNDLVHQGKVRYVACSNFPGWQVAEADHQARSAHVNRFVGNQFEWSLLARGAEAEIVPACRHYDVGILPYFPLASGLLTGKYKRGEPFPEGSRLSTLTFFQGMATEERFDRIERLTSFATERGHSLTELAMSWLACQRGVSSVLAGATSPEQVRANAAAIEWQLTAGELGEVDELLKG
jgi:aryl-alcohol dehydrogenase-like predicted oxidoreductase